MLTIMNYNNKTNINVKFNYQIIFRATSTSNVMMLSSTTPMGPLTRRSSERELNDCSGKKRAASAGGLSNRSTDGKFSYYL